MLLEISCLTELWSVDSLSGATTSYIAEAHPTLVVGDVDWSTSGKLLVDLRLDLFYCFQIG